MAFNVNFGDKYFVFIFILICTETHIFASKDDVYKVDVGEEYSNFQDISVIEYHDRQRRQTDSEAANTNTSASTTPKPVLTTSPDRDSWNVLHDEHRYYTSLIFVPDDINGFWVELTDVAGHSSLSDSHRTAVTAKLPFKFPFYGHLIDNVTIATGGFLYMSPFIHKFLTATQYIAPLMANFDTKSGGKGSTVLYTNVGFLYMSPFLHQWLTATQYIAPLMANFDTRLGNASEVLYASIGSKFVVEWRDVHLQDQNGRSNEATGAFRFQTILHRNGSITFAYRRIPIKISDIRDKEHKVTIGLSDAFYFDKTNNDGTRRRTIYEYHRVVLNTTFIQEGTIVLINPEPTCNQYTDCESCVSSNILFECRWCGIINRCSDSVDWHRQKWLNAGCVHLSGKSNCSSIPTSSPKPTTPSDMGTKIAVIVIVVVIVLALIGSVVGWVYYAYTHPTSASGMWLMEHRPSQMKAKMSNMKFWKRNGAAGDKYAVESTA